MKKYITTLLFLIIIFSVFSLCASVSANQPDASDVSVTESESANSDITSAQDTYETAGRYYNVNMKGMPAFVPVITVIIILVFLAVFLMFSNKIKEINEFFSSHTDERSENKDTKKIKDDASAPTPDDNNDKYKDNKDE